MANLPTLTRPLVLTTPLMRGNAVRNAQYLLKNNKYGKFYTGEVDGIYGTQTAQAVYRAKYWLGYPEKDINKAYFTQIRSYLLEEKKLPYWYQYRRKQRLKKAAQKTLGQKAYEKAVSQIGVKESPAYSNNVYYSRWYGIRGPWCAMFLTWCFVMAGSRAFVRGWRYAYVPYILNDARYGRNNLTTTRNPVKGDLAIYSIGGREADHIGIFEGWKDGGRLRFTAIEGNTSAGGSQTNGGAVLRKERYIHQTLAFVHVGR
jgi:peptidoglycan hydrolase-like protein with peptidoglycan-binding domain